MQYKGYEILRVKTGWQVNDGIFSSQRKTFRTLTEAKDAIDHTIEMRSLGRSTN